MSEAGTGRDSAPLGEREVSTDLGADRESVVRISIKDLEQLRVQVASLTRRVAALEQSSGSFSRPAANTLPSEERRIGLTTVNRVGAITLALGILFFFKYAADNNWIGPAGRLLAGLLTGLCFLAFGERLRKNQAALALGINGCGLAILYITAYASDSLYKLLVPVASFLLMVGVTALGTAIAMRAASQTLAAISLGAAFITPLLMDKNFHGSIALVYLALVAAVGVWIALRQQWPVLPATNLLISAFCATLSDAGTVAAALFFIFQAAVLWLARVRVSTPDTLAASLYVCGHAAAVLAGLALISQWATPSSVALTLASLLLAIYGIALLSVGVAQRSNINRLTGLVFIALVIGKLYLYDIWQLSYGFRITAFVLLGAMLLAASFIYSRWKTKS